MWLYFWKFFYFFLIINILFFKYLFTFCVLRGVWDDLVILIYMSIYLFMNYFGIMEVIYKYNMCVFRYVLFIFIVVYKICMWILELLFYRFLEGSFIYFFYSIK